MKTENKAISNEVMTRQEMDYIRNHTNWSDNVIRYIQSFDEAEIYMKEGLVEARVGGHPALIRKDIDWSDFSCLYLCLGYGRRGRKNLQGLSGRRGQCYVMHGQ